MAAKKKTKKKATTKAKRQTKKAAAAVIGAVSVGRGAERRADVWVQARVPSAVREAAAAAAARAGTSVSAVVRDALVAYASAHGQRPAGYAAAYGPDPRQLVWEWSA